MIRSAALSSALALFAVLGSPSPALAGILYVDASLATGANDGSSWANAFQGTSGVRLALAAAVAGDQIWVADGTYLPTQTGNRSRSFDLKTGVYLFGGFAGGEPSLADRDPIANPAVLSGDLAGDDGLGNYGDNSLHVVQASSISNSILDGFHIRGGNADAGSGGGGGFKTVLADVLVRRCDFVANKSADWGGAVADVSYGDYLGCRFEGNTAGQGGGAVYSETDHLFEDCQFRDNHAGGDGGAVEFSNNSGSWFSRCLFTGNTASRGSGVYFEYGFINLFRNCLFYGNTCTDPGGGTIHEEKETYYIYLYNTTVASNVGIGVVSGHFLYIDNSIVYFNSAGSGGQGGDRSQFSCIQNGPAGTGMIFADPQFVNPAGGDFHLAPTSPCLDSAANGLDEESWTSLGMDVFDLDRNPRRDDVAGAPDTGGGPFPIMDMGAYERPGFPFAVFCGGDGSLATPCPCGNTATLPGRGCVHSAVGSKGSLLIGSGTTNPDTALMTGSQLRGGVLCILLQGDATVDSGAFFGDGLRCVAGHLKRIGSGNASPSGVFVHPGPGDPSISSRSAALGDPIAPGTQRWYQVWFRDNAPGYCPPPEGSTSNVTSGVIANW